VVKSRPADARKEKEAGGASAARPAPDARAVESAMKRLRENIDQVDAVLVKLLNQRARWALEIGEVKKGASIPIYQPDREKQVLSRVQSQNRGPLGEAAMQRLFERIIDESRRLERIGGDGGTEGAEPDGGRATGREGGS
jgi:chorismate mutase